MFIMLKFLHFATLYLLFCHDCACVQDMTYVKQLENYEEEVMAKRLEEMPESEREKLMAAVEAEKERRRDQQQQASK